jgi:hypothetical protein
MRVLFLAEKSVFFLLHYAKTGSGAKQFLINVYSISFPRNRAVKA